MTAVSLKSEIVDQSKLPKGVKGIIVTSVFPKTPAAVIGLKPGDIVTEVNEKACPTLRDFYRLLNDPSAKKLAFTVIRDGETVTTLAYVRK
jgi:S1-C subfamily serine protease